MFLVTFFYIRLQLFNEITFSYQLVTPLEVSTCRLIFIVKIIFANILQICRVEDLLVDGIVKGSVIHIHRARTIIVNNNGLITASELGKGVYSGTKMCNLLSI